MKEVLKKLAALILALVSSQAFPEKHSNKYVGATADIFIYGLYAENAVTVFTGYRRRDLGFELGYTYLPRSKYIFSAGDDYFQSRNVYLDGIYYLNCTKRISILGIIGVGHYHTKYYDAGKTSYEDDLNLRLGAGVEYEMFKKLALNAAYKIQFNRHTFIRFISTVSLGLKLYL